MSIVAGVYGGLDQSESWHLTVTPSGHAEVVIGFGRNVATKRFKVEGEELRKFRETLKQSEFFKVAKVFGEDAPDLEVRTVAVTIGQRTGVATFRNFDSISQRETIREARKCLSVRHAVQQMLDAISGIDDARELEIASLEVVEKEILATADSRESE